MSAKAEHQISAANRAATSSRLRCAAPTDATRARTEKAVRSARGRSRAGSRGAVRHSVPLRWDEFVASVAAIPDDGEF